MMRGVGARIVVVDAVRYFPDQLAAVQRNLTDHDPVRRRQSVASSRTGLVRRPMPSISIVTSSPARR